MESQLPELRDISGVIPPDPPAPELWPWVLLGVCILLLFILVGFFISVYGRKTKKEPTPAERAMEALAAIPNNWPTSNQLLAAMRALRTYIKERFGVGDLNQSIERWQKSISQNPALQSVYPEIVELCEVYQKIQYTGMPGKDIQVNYFYEFIKKCDQLDPTAKEAPPPLPKQ